MKKQKDTKISKKRFTLHIASAFAGFLVAGVGIELATKAENPAGYIGAAIIGIYVLFANFYQLWVIMAEERGR